MSWLGKICNTLWIRFCPPWRRTEVSLLSSFFELAEGQAKEGLMKKTGKSGLGHLKKMEGKSRQMLTGRLAMAATAETKKVACRARRRCA